ncbi:MAG TPA: UPF0262 family protein [Rhizomicrobium sp.]|jgi:uncharacterized protein (UPF0262 family)|nr:UPF0262 family protein [Rhizomicrobium sp.]
MNYRLSAITLDEASVVYRSRAIEQEREVAMYDLLEKNSFRPVGSDGGPYHLHLGMEENRLVLDVRLENGDGHGRVMLSLTPLRKVVKDYFLICESYYKAIRSAPPHQIEALDMARKTLHDEGAAELQKRLEGKIETDFDTARRLFTLVCVLQMRG